MMVKHVLLIWIIIIFFSKTILPVYRDEILKIYNITDKDIDIYLEWIDAKDVYHYKENIKLNVNIKDIK